MIFCRTAVRAIVLADVLEGVPMKIQGCRIPCVFQGLRNIMGTMGPSKTINIFEANLETLAIKCFVIAPQGQN